MQVRRTVGTVRNYLRTTAEHGCSLVKVTAADIRTDTHATSFRNERPHHAEYFALAFYAQHATIVVRC